MIQSMEILAREAIALPLDQRLTLAQRILASVEPPCDPANDEAWEVEIRERIRRYDAGETTAISAETVFAELDRRLA